NPACIVYSSRGGYSHPAGFTLQAGTMPRLDRSLKNEAPFRALQRTSLSAGLGLSIWAEPVFPRVAAAAFGSHEARRLGAQSLDQRRGDQRRGIGRRRPSGIDLDQLIAQLSDRPALAGWSGANDARQQVEHRRPLLAPAGGALEAPPAPCTRGANLPQHLHQQ